VLARTRVLVVDDNPDAGDSLGSILELLGAQVRVARGGPEALETFAGYRPSVVLLDIGMPGMNGYEVARAIRTRFAQEPVTLVALTGWGQEDDRRRAREAGFDHHLVKPAEIEALQRLLASLEAPGQGQVAA
jgi:CheY-like chemotaxis protein